MTVRRFKDVEWNLASSSGAGIASWDFVSIAVLMDIRDELKKLNSLLYCSNFTGIPQQLRAIRLNTTKRKRKAK